MTANVEIITAEKENVLLAPNKALRFFMEDETGQTQRYQDKGIWIIQNGTPTRISIKTGVSDDEQTEISGSGLNEGSEIVLEKSTAKEMASRPMRMRMLR